MSKYSDYVKKQKEFIHQIEVSSKGTDFILYSNLINLDRQYLTSMNYSQTEEEYIEEDQKYNLYSE